jgi:Xaa-Pro aminopeptidase
MTNSPTTSRLARLRAKLAENGVDALLISQPENRAYLSGFTGSSGWLLITHGHAFIATDFRYYEQVGLECPSYELVKVVTTFAAVLPEMIERAGVNRLAFESDHATFSDVQDWSKAVPDVEWVPTKGTVMGLRAVKDAGEIATLKAAIELADEALAAGLAQAQPGMTELDLAWIIESHMRTHGAQVVAFDMIVACGPNGARPHARAGRERLLAGEPIVIDMGARLDGYNSDLTRTVCLGQPNDPARFWEIYNTVLRAQIAAEAAIRPGMNGQEVDAVARDLIAQAGYGDYFGHGLGHGVGLAVHEEPRFSRTLPSTLAAGNVVTVEPGIYLPGWGGVRIEDVVLVTENGAEVLTRASKVPVIGQTIS